MLHKDFRLQLLNREGDKTAGFDLLLDHTASLDLVVPAGKAVLSSGFKGVSRSLMLRAYKEHKVFHMQNSSTPLLHGLPVLGFLERKSSLCRQEA